VTGLPLAQANLARLQEASETLIWRDSDEAMSAFDKTLQQLGLRFVQGARFWHVLDERSGKDQAVNWLTRQYHHYRGHRALTLGLGDGPNDAPLLDSVDYAIVVKALNRQGVQCFRIHLNGLSHNAGRRGRLARRYGSFFRHVVRKTHLIAAVVFHTVQATISNRL
jgi:Predicted hydrolase (HAD superfamily)